MKFGYLAAVVTLALATPVVGQVNPAVADDDMRPIIASLNKCLNAFDEKAKAKKLSTDIYKTAIQGACTTEITETRGLISLRNERNSDQAFFEQQYDREVSNAKAKMVTDYAMR